MATGQIVSKKRPRQNGTGISAGDQVRFLSTQTGVQESDKHLTRVECAKHAVSDAECRVFYLALGVTPAGVTA